MPLVHYHFHQYNFMPPQGLVYPNYYATPVTTGTYNRYYPLEPSFPSPTVEQPYPPGYLPGPFAPSGFQNLAPNASSTQGVIYVFLPTADAVVYLNGQEMRGDGRNRKFTTPVLASNSEFQYWVTAVFPQGGQTITKYRKAIVGAGEYTVADFTRPPEEQPVHLAAGPVDPNSVVR